VLPLSGDRKPVPITAEHTQNQAPGSFSRDGRWIVFSGADRTGPQVYVVPFPQAAGRWQISRTTSGTLGVNPRWHKDGRIYFATEGSLVAARMDGSGSAPTVLDLTPLGPIGPSGGPRNWFAVAPDSTRVLVNMAGSTPTGPLRPLTVVIDWARGK
jgi:hypothetical protein